MRVGPTYRHPADGGAIDVWELARPDRDEHAKGAPANGHVPTSYALPNRGPVAPALRPSLA